MASIIRIKRSSVSGNPSTLAAGELAYSALPDNGSNGGDRLYIGMGTETAGNAANHVVIGGKYFTDKLSHAPGTLTANAAIVVDADSKIDQLNVDNLTLNGNAITSTNANGNIEITPNGTGSIVLDGQSWPQADGSSGQYLRTNGAGQLSWAAIPSGTFTIAGNTGTDLFSTGETLSILGSGPVSTAATDNTVTISVADASTSTKGIASFNSASFDVASGVVSIKDGGVSNSQLVNSSLTIGSTTISLGSTSTSLAGLTELAVDNLNINGNSITATNANGNIVLVPDGTGVVDTSGKRIIGVADPVNPQDAATKNYVDNQVTGLSWKNSAHLLADSNVALTGSTATLVIDGHAALDQTDDGYRILLKGQTTGSENGIYVYNDNGTSYTLTRATDADAFGELVGAAIFIKEGVTYANTGWVQTEHYLTSFAGQTWVQFSGAGAYAAGAGLGQSGTEFFVKVAALGGIEIVDDSLQLKSTIAGDGLTHTDGVINVVGTTGRISVSSNAVDIDTNYAGQTSITTVGTIAIGTWNATAIAATKGGTGFTTYAAGDLIYASATDTLSKLAAGDQGQVLQINASGIPVWGDIDGGTY